MIPIRQDEHRIRSLTGGVRISVDTGLGAVLMVGMSQLFFLSAHNMRAEPFVLFLMLVNILWLYSSGGPVLGMLCGLGMGLSPAVHPAVILFWCSFPVLLVMEARARRLEAIATDRGPRR